MFKITQQDYDVIVFLTRLVYYDLEYPEPFHCVDKIEIGKGLKINIFDMDEYSLFIICGTNSLVDWMANIKVALGIMPHQYQQAYYYIKNNAPHHNKPIVIAGHSLGGGIAEYVASCLYYHDNVICLTFNGCGCCHLIHPILVKYHGVYNIVTSKDVLNCIVLNIPFIKRYLQHTGKVIVLEDNEHKFLSVGSHCNFKLFCKLKVEDLYKEVVITHENKS